KEPRFETRFAFVKDCPSRRINLRAAKRARESATFLATVKALRFSALANVICKPRLENKFQTSRVVGKLRVKIFEIIAHRMPCSSLLCREFQTSTRSTLLVSRRQ